MRDCGKSEMKDMSKDYPSAKEYVSKLLKGSRVSRAMTDEILLVLRHSATGYLSRDKIRKTSFESGESYEVTELITLDTNVNLCRISSDEMSTEDMLRKFSDEPHVIFDVGHLK